jgi:hypothetical protein
LPYPIKVDNNYFAQASIGFSTGITLTNVQMTAYGSFGTSELIVGELLVLA